MQHRHRILCSALVAGLALSTASLAVAETPAKSSLPPATQPGATATVATQPAASQPAVDRDKVRALIQQAQSQDPVEAADGVVQLKFLARDGVPVWEAMQPGDLASVRGLLTWLKQHPGNIHRVSALRPELEMMNVYIVDANSGEVRQMGGADIVQYGWLARELVRDGDPYGYWAIMDVARSATELLGRAPDPVTFTYVMPYLDRHLDLHLVLANLKEWKGYWAKPITKEREFQHPFFRELSNKPSPPESPWSISTVVLLKSLDKYQAELARLGLWQTPPWELKYTDKTSTPELLDAMKAANFPTRQHIARLIRDRLTDSEQRERLVEAIKQDHPHTRHLQLLLAKTEVLPYVHAIRKVWPKELTEQVPGLLDDITSPNPRRNIEGVNALVQTLVYWPDREAANRTAVELFEASGAGKTEMSIVILATVDQKEGVTALLQAYQKEDMPDLSYNTLHQWVRNASQTFRDQCADRDLAGMMVRLSTASQPVIDTSKSDWNRVLRLSYDLVWWKLNSPHFEWNDKNHRIEVPEAKLVRPTEEQVVDSYKNRHEELRQYLDAATKRWQREQAAAQQQAQPAPQGVR